ncbi:MAG: NF038129 family PEP-CTERM protein [Terracidiphilus sp.]|jgi:hypothetical protein
MSKIKFILCAVLFCFAMPALADTYDVTVNTSSIAGTTGSLDFDFSPGPNQAQAASLQILGFSSDGSLAASPELVGDVSGNLPFTITFDNGTGFNDYFDGFTYGSTLSFDVSLYGPALSSPDGTSNSNSIFSFSMFSDAAGTVPVLTSDTIDGFAFIVNINPNGSTSLSNFSAETNAEPPTSATPEPGSLLFLTTGLVILAFTSLRRRQVGG